MLLTFDEKSTKAKMMNTAMTGVGVGVGLGMCFLLLVGSGGEGGLVHHYCL